MRVKLFWKNDRVCLKELYKDGTLKSFSFQNVKEWWSGKSPPESPDGDWPEALSSRISQQLEEDINAWLSQNLGIKVVDIKQSASYSGYMPSMWLISIWFEEAE